MAQAASAQHAHDASTPAAPAGANTPFDSQRTSLIEWLDVTLTADLYLSADASGDAPGFAARFWGIVREQWRKLATGEPGRAHRRGVRRALGGQPATLLDHR
jgi:hypothetical protein